MLTKISTRPRDVALLYLGLIPAFGLIYYLNPGFWEEPLTAVQSGYFSVVTITTLGYGEITPQTEVARALTALEAILGIVIIGIFLNAVAQSASHQREERHKSTAKEHLRAQYQEWREDLVKSCLRAMEGSYATDYELEKKLVSFREFRRYFLEEDRDRWYAVLNGMQDDEKVIEDIFILGDLFSQQINVALGKIYTTNNDGLAVLTRVAQRPRLLQSLDIYSADLAKYVGNYLLAVLAMWSTVSGKMESDFIDDAIRSL